MPDYISEAWHLRKVQEQISTAQLIIARQRLRLTQLRQAECDSSLAETILLAMEEALRAMYQHEAQVSDTCAELRRSQMKACASSG